MAPQENLLRHPHIRTPRLQPSPAQPGPLSAPVSACPLSYRLLAAKAIIGRRKGSRTLIDGASLRAYYKSLPDYVPGIPIPNAPCVTNPRRRRARA
jgi:hypothetical protein